MHALKSVGGGDEGLRFLPFLRGIRTFYPPRMAHSLPMLGS